jgi:metalloendopeptidase OMA1, mitochondrial
MKNEDEIAGVMAHEIGHALCRHNAEQITNLGIITLVRFLFMETFFNDSKSVQSVYSLLFSLPKQRKMEFEADYVGIHLMARACYDPAKIIRAFEILKEYSPPEDGNVGVEAYFSTHPSIEDRLTKFKTEMPLAVKEYKNFCSRNPKKSDIKNWFDNFEK